MSSFSCHISGEKHSIIKKFKPLLRGLDSLFGEEYVTAGRFLPIRNVCPDLKVIIKGYDDSKKTYILQARQAGALQYFYVKTAKENRPEIERLVESNFAGY